MDSFCPSPPVGKIPSADELRRQAGLLKALADPNRLWLLHRLRDGEVCVCELNTHLPLSQATLSHHLRVLAEADLISSRKSGRWSLYKTTATGRGALHCLSSLVAP